MRIKLYIDTQIAGCVHEDIVEIPDGEWTTMSPQERKRRLDDEAEVFLANHVDYGAYPLDK